MCTFTLTFTLTACSGITDNSNMSNAQGSSNTQANSNTYNSESSNADVISDNISNALSDMFSSRDGDSSYDESKATKLVISDSDNIIHITKEGTYILSGQTSNGQVIVDASKSDKIQIILNNVDITNPSSAAIYVKQADKVFLTLANGTTNILKTTGEFVNDSSSESNIDAVIFSKDDLTINGSGTLTIDVSNGHGIVSKNDLKVTNGIINITATSTALTGKDSVRISGGTFSLTSGKDAIHSENSDVNTMTDTVTKGSKGFIYICGGTFNITSDQDGISASSNLQIDSGTFNITTGGGYENAPVHNDKGFGMGDIRNRNWGNENLPQMPDGFDNNMTPPQMPDGNFDRSNFDKGNFNRDNFDRDNFDRSSYDRGNFPQEPRRANEDNNSNTTITETDSVSVKGIKAGGNLIINNGTFNINSMNDALHSDNNLDINSGTINISAGDDGIHADGILQINDGTITINNSYEGIEGNTITVNGGNISLASSDDGLNASGSTPLITINGGNITVNADGDGVDSNDALVVNGGELYVYGPTNSGNGALDYERTGTINGGTVVAIGATGMAQNFGTDSTQGSMLVNVSGSANDEITLTDSNGNVIVNCISPKSYGCIVISSPLLKVGNTYTLTAGNNTKTVEMTDLITGGTGFSFGNQGGNRGNRNNDKGNFR